MNTNNKNDIITALATPYGRSAVAVIRVSGAGCIELVGRFLTRATENGKISYNTFKNGDFVEKLMAASFKAPKTYTGEDTVELYPHGNTLICDAIIKALTDGGARIAEKGEFTRRAFLNGKLDLMQCEALADVIDAQTAEGLKYGNLRYDGGFTALSEVEKRLNRALSSIEAVLHYCDELEENEIDDALLNDVEQTLDFVEQTLQTELDGFAGGRIANDGFKVALIGAPNVGKSTLLNALTGSDRAIVTAIAGTTRDTIDGEYIYKDRKFKITDTAGLNDGTTDEVEKIGIDRAKAAAKSADAVMLVTDGKATVEFECECRVIKIKNKCDGAADVGTEYKRAESDGILRMSAKKGVNVVALKQLLYELCPKDYGEICNYRQYACVKKCVESCKAAKIEHKKAGGLEIVAALLYEAYSAIVELYGGQADEKVIGSVFERFCVGK